MTHLSVCINGSGGLATYMHLEKSRLGLGDARLRVEVELLGEQLVEPRVGQPRAVAVERAESAQLCISSTRSAYLPSNLPLRPRKRGRRAFELRRRERGIVCAPLLRDCLDSTDPPVSAPK